jgi:hypothetical protein
LRPDPGEPAADPQHQVPRPRVGSAWTCGRSGSTGVPTVLASIDRPFVVERPDERGGLVIAPA